MKFNITPKVLRFLFMAMCIVAISSCKKLLDIDPKSSVDISQAYRNVYDADAAVIGIYGKVLGLAKQYELWNELRADQMDITQNADQFLRQLSEHTVTADNPYINPRLFYEVIINCNDALRNFDVMLKENRFKLEEYNQRYSDIGAVRSWLYLQLAIHFGNIPYVTDPLAQVSDLQDVTKFPMVPLKQVIDSLVKFMESLPTLSEYPSGSNLTGTIDGINSSKFYINKYFLMGDLYLWQGQYLNAASSYKRLMEIGGPTGVTEQWYNRYKLPSPLGTSNITYGRTTDFSTLNYNSGWRFLFERPVSDAEFDWEMIWVLPFTANFSPPNPFIELFSNIGGSYLVRPSQQAMDYWNSQRQTYGFPLDARGPLTYRFNNGEPVIMKYLYNYINANNLPVVSLLSKQGKWFLWRAATLHLRYAEAANRDGKYKLAWALINNGLPNAYNISPAPADVTNVQQTFLPFPYDFDARVGETPRYRSSWYRNGGIRGRANLVTVPVTNPADSLLQIENMIIQEAALEIAFEGQRWPDLLRIAIRRNDPAFLADKVYDKLRKSNLSASAANAARAKLMNKDWFFPFKWQ